MSDVSDGHFACCSGAIRCLEEPRKGVQVQCAAIFLLLIGLLSCSAPAATARLSKGPSSPMDAAQDARLAVQVRLRAEAIPLRRVLRALADETGVRLAVAGSAGDERLVAFVPDASLADVLLAVADLYR